MLATTPAVPSPRRHGEKGQACVITRVQPCILATAPASLRPAQRGEGGAAAPDEGPWEVGCVRHCSSAHAELHRLPVKQRSAPHPRPPPHLLPVATGRRDRHALSPECSLACLRRRQPSLRPAQRGEGTSMRFLGCAACNLATAPAFPSPRAAGRSELVPRGRTPRSVWSSRLLQFLGIVVG